MSEHTILDQRLFQPDKVRYIGDEVAAVAASDEDAAQEALDLIRVEYEELPAVFEPEDALKPGAPLIHEDFAEHETTFDAVGRKGNQVCKVRFRYGDVEAGLCEADDVIENRFTTHAHHPTCLETHGALASCDAAGGGGLTLWTTTQGVSKVQEWVARLLDLPMTRVRVIGTAVGGGFGGKKPRIDLDAVGARIRDLPITSEKVLRALNDLQKG